jgi:hypothetical protein
VIDFAEPEAGIGHCSRSMKTGEKRMTRNFVPRHVFLRHETEWQAVREAADRSDESEMPEKPAIHIAYSDKTNTAQRNPTSAACSG